MKKILKLFLILSLCLCCSLTFSCKKKLDENQIIPVENPQKENNQLGQIPDLPSPTTQSQPESKAASLPSSQPASPNSQPSSW